MKNCCLIFLSLVFFACSKKAAVVTPQKAEELIAYAGNERVKLSFRLNDNSIHYCDIFWKNRSASKRINKSEAVGGVINTIVDNLEEGNHSFEIITYTADGVASPSATRVQVKVYGNAYKTSISNRAVADQYFIYNKTPYINWKAATTGDVGMVVNYTATDEQVKEVRLSKSESQVLLPNHKEHTDISYRTLYLPEPNCIDTFAVSNETITSPTYYASVTARSVIEKAGFFTSIISQTSTDIHPDVEYTTLQLQNSGGSRMSLFVIRADLSKGKVSLTTLMPNNTTTFGLQNMKTMAEHRDAAGGKILASVNADFFDWTPVAGTPWGPVVVEGNIVKNYVKAGVANTTYFGVKKDGSLAIGKALDLTTADYNLFQNLVGGGTNHLMLNGVRQYYNDQVREPRTMIGYTPDKIAYIVVVDGRQAGYSVGMTIDELGATIASLGVNYATNLDGGGSSTMVLKKNNAFEIVNSYSDASPRAVANGLAIKLLD